MYLRVNSSICIYTILFSCQRTGIPQLKGEKRQNETLRISTRPRVRAFGHGFGRRNPYHRCNSAAAVELSSDNDRGNTNHRDDSAWGVKYGYNDYPDASQYRSLRIFRLVNELRTCLSGRTGDVCSSKTALRRSIALTN